MKLHQSQSDQAFCCGSRRISPTLDTCNPLHRITTVMKQEGITTRVLSTRLDKTEATVIEESNPSSDMSLSDLYKWQAALRVPIADLLVEPGTNFSSTILLRTRLLKLMRSVRSIQEHSTEDAIQTFARHLSDQLTKMMPELEEVSAWPSTGQLRKPHELGAIAYNLVPAQIFSNSSEDM